MTRTNLCWSYCRIIAHTPVSKNQKWFHLKYRVSNMCDHGWCGCSPHNAASWTWPTSWESPEHALTIPGPPASCSLSVSSCYRVALTTWARLSDLPTSGLPAVLFYHWIRLQCHFRCKVNIDFAAHWHFWIPILVLNSFKISVLVKNWRNTLTCGRTLTHKRSGWTIQIIISKWLRFI